MNWLKNKVRNWLEIQEPMGESINIVQLHTHEGNCFKNKIWYRGDASELHQYYANNGDEKVCNNLKFWGAITDSSVGIRKIHTGIPALMVDRIADIVIDNLNSINVENNVDKQVILQEMLEESDYKEIIKNAIKQCLFMGDGAFKISYDPDISKYPLLEFIGADNVEYIYSRGRIKTVIFNTTYYTQKHGRIDFKEYYDKEGISYKAFANNKEVKIEDIEEISTQNLKSVDTKGVMLAIPMMFDKSSKYDGRGKSIFDGKEDNFDSLDESWSQWIDSLRANRTNTYIPESLLPIDENGVKLKPNPYNNRYIATNNDMSEDNRQEIKTVSGEIQHEALLSTYITALDLCLQGIISPSTLGIDVKKLDNAEAQREKEKTTLYTRNKIIRVLEKTLPKVAEKMIQCMDGIKNNTPGSYDISVSFGEYANPSFEAIVETIAKGKNAGILSIEMAVEELYGDSLTKDEKAKEVERLKEEAGIIEKYEPAVSDEIDE